MHVLGQEAHLDLIGRWLVAEHGVVLEGVRPIVGGSMGEQSEWHLIAVPVEADICNSVSNLCDACPPGTSNNNYNESVCYLCNTTCPADVI